MSATRFCRRAAGCWVDLCRVSLFVVISESLPRGGYTLPYTCRGRLKQKADHRDSLTQTQTGTVMPGDQMVATSKLPTAKKNGWSMDPQGHTGGETWHRACGRAIDGCTRESMNKHGSEQIPLSTMLSISAIRPDSDLRFSVSSHLTFSVMHLTNKSSCFRLSLSSS